MSHLSINQLKAREPIDKIKIHSLEGGIYIATVYFDGAEHTIADDHGKPLKAHCLSEMKELLKRVNYRTAELHHRSAYDEMVGLEQNTADAMVLDITAAKH